jgi:hypothetical protein
MIHYSPTSLSQVINWRIKATPVYRILDSIEWLDNFFDTGEIQLSSFEKFRSYKDEMQGDYHEGKAAIICEDEEKKTHIIGYESGTNGYVLSTTKSLEEKVVNDFNGKCAILIKHPTLFGLELSKKLPFIFSGLEGSCDYVESKNRFLEKQLNTDNLLESINELDKRKVLGILSELTMGMELFAKHKKYEHQKEYRFIWFSNGPVIETIKVKCPEVIEYCDKIVF